MINARTRRPTLTACYAHFGINLSYIPRRLWSAVSPTGRTVVTLWTDTFDNPAMSQYSTFGKRVGEWIGRLENRRRRDQLAIVGIGGTFDSIIVRRADLNLRPPQATEFHIGPLMRLLELDHSSGEFRAEEVA